MEKYPNSAEALVAASDVYSVKGSPLFSPEKAFAALEKANRIDPNYDAQMQLARYYINAFGTKQDVRKPLNYSSTTLMKTVTHQPLSAYWFKYIIAMILKHLSMKNDY